MSAAAAPAPDAPGLAVEVATWPPLETVAVGPWLVGLSDGFTRRANCLLPFAEPDGSGPDDVDAALDEVEAVYRGRGLPTTVRVCRAGAPSDLAERLAARGYVRVSHPHVLAARVTDADPDADGGAGWTGPVEVTDDPDDTWLRLWRGAAAGVAELELAARVVRGAPARYLTTRDDDGAPVGVLRVGLAGGWGAVSCLVVAPSARRRGVGRALTRAAVDVAAASGAGRAFLQVNDGNDGALALYDRLGFTRVDRYAYWQRPVTT